MISSYSEVEDFINNWPEDKRRTRDDISEVLAELGKPGENQDVKQEVIGKLFNKRNTQGVSVVDTLGTYPEY